MNFLQNIFDKFKPKNDYQIQPLQPLESIQQGGVSIPPPYPNDYANPAVNAPKINLQQVELAQDFKPAQPIQAPAPNVGFGVQPIEDGSSQLQTKEFDFDTDFLNQQNTQQNGAWFKPSQWNDEQRLKAQYWGNFLNGVASSPYNPNAGFLGSLGNGIARGNMNAQRGLNNISGYIQTKSLLKDWGADTSGLSMYGDYSDASALQMMKAGITAQQEQRKATAQNLKNEYQTLKSNELQIKLSTLPDLEKAKLLKANAEAQIKTSNAYYANDLNKNKIASMQSQQYANYSGIPIRQQQANTGSFNALLNGVESGALDPNSIELPNIAQNNGYAPNLPQSLPAQAQGGAFEVFNPNVNLAPIGNKFPTGGASNINGPKFNSNIGAGGGVQANKTLTSLDAIKGQLDNFEKTFEVMPSKTNAYTAGKLRALTGTLTPGEANFNAQRTLLFNKIARDLGGEKGVLSDGDIKRIEASLPTLYDSKEQKYAKMRAIYDLLNNQYSKFRKQPQGQYNPSSQQIGKYKVTVK